MAINEKVEPIHYRVGSKITHCGCEILPNGNDIERIVIERIEFHETDNVGGRKENNVWVAFFRPNPYATLPMVLNSTNRRRLSKLYPECKGYINQLTDVAVRLTREKTRDPQDGTDTWGLRISKLPPAPEKKPEKKTLTKENVEAVREWMVKNGKTVEDLRSFYVMSEEIEKMLTI